MENKTPLQMLIEFMDKNPSEITHTIYNKATELLPVEKEQIKNAYNQGYRDGEDAEESTKVLIDVSQWANAEKYFNQTYNHE